MKDKKENFFARHMTFCFCILIVLSFFIGYRFYAYCARRPMRTVKEIPLRALYGMPCRITCPVSFYGSGSRLHGPNIRQVQIREQIPGALCGCFLYDKSARDITLMITWFDPSFLGGQIHYFYEIDSPEVKAELLDFISKYEVDLQDHKKQETMLKMLHCYHDELSELGDGDPYVGLERAGVFDWIREGKDPEAEWKKKFSADGERP